MHKKDGKIVFSPSDLMKYMESEFVTWMDRFALEFPGEVEPDQETEINKLLQKKGLAHERSFLQRLQETGHDIFDAAKEQDKFEATLNAMKNGAEVIYQGALSDQEFIGFADFLIKIPGESSLGNYHYEPWDTKLALTAKPQALIQLACYADLLRPAQQVLPEHLHVVLGNREIQNFPAENYYGQYRQLRENLLAQQSSFDRDNPPDFACSENFRRWTTHANKIMEQKDHLCRVANIRTAQIKKPYSAGITTMTALADSPLQFVPKIQPSIFAVLKRQAQLQIASRGLDSPQFDFILPKLEGEGLAALPPASPLDVYFDIEGYPLVAGGLEYLFGATVVENDTPGYVDWWAHTPEQEKTTCEDFLDWLCQRWQQDPGMHVYHYAVYEKTALRRLTRKYATRKKEFEDLLNSEIFVDLYKLVKQSIRVGTPNYSLKNIEHLYREKRGADLATGADSMVFYQRWLDAGDGDTWHNSKILADIRDYNREDCDSTWRLTEWLRRLQHQQARL